MLTEGAIFCQGVKAWQVGKNWLVETFAREQIGAVATLRALLEAGLVVAGSSDAPVVDFDPLRGIRCAVERKTAKGER